MSIPAQLHQNNEITAKLIQIQKITDNFQYVAAIMATFERVLSLLFTTVLYIRCVNIKIQNWWTAAIFDFYIAHNSYSIAARITTF